MANPAKRSSPVPKVVPGRAACPNWWPSTAEVALLDVRDGFCRVSFVDTSTGKVERYAEPAVLRRAADGTLSHWGRRALAWKGRLADGQVLEVFPTGWPVDTGLARWYLKKLTETYLPKRSCRIFLMETKDMPWARQLWQETLEDSAFSVQGFLAPWQHDVLIAKGGQPEQALSPFLHFRVDDCLTSWQLITGGQVAESGSDTGLSATRLLSQMGDFLRRRCSVEVATGVLQAVALASCPEQMAKPCEPTVAVAGRQLLSGLPTRQTFAWAEFMATRPTVVEAWHGVKARIYAQAEQICGVAAGHDEGLDLPGWRVLTSGPLADLFVEGPVVRLFDGL